MNEVDDICKQIRADSQTLLENLEKLNDAEAASLLPHLEAIQKEQAKTLEEIEKIKNE